MITHAPVAPSRAGAPATPPAAATAGGLKPYTESIPGSLVKFEMVPIPGGTVTQAGATKPTQVKPFWIAKTEVTWDAFDIFVFRLDQTEEQKAAGADAASRPSKPYGAPDRGFGHQGYPALAMTYHSAEQYCKWLSAKTGKKYRLPTEAEWEYAARAGNGATAPMGKDDLSKVAWYWDTTEDKTQAVGTKAANAWGIHDVLGNVAEWCTGQGGTPVVRGGSYYDKAEKVQFAAREQQTPAWNANDPQNPKSRWWLANAPFVGFRVVCEP